MSPDPPRDLGRAQILHLAAFGDVTAAVLAWPVAAMILLGLRRLIRRAPTG